VARDAVSGADGDRDGCAVVAERDVTRRDVDDAARPGTAQRGASGTACAPPYSWALGTGEPRHHVGPADPFKLRCKPPTRCVVNYGGYQSLLCRCVCSWPRPNACLPAARGKVRRCSRAGLQGASWAHSLRTRTLSSPLVSSQFPSSIFFYISNVVFNCWLVQLGASDGTGTGIGMVRGETVSSCLTKMHLQNRRRAKLKHGLV
jgi:hypothetical protein